MGPKPFKNQDRIIEEFPEGRKLLEIIKSRKKKKKKKKKGE